MCRCCLAEEAEESSGGNGEGASGDGGGALSARSGGAARGPACEACGVADNLWMCLVCGHVGCGRYAHEHAVRHFEASGHTYAIELSSQRVWDYAGDGYVRTRDNAAHARGWRARRPCSVP